ncbi:hypothetical protein HIM_03984 [Hirsutella minnesotensis 3608]|uniref:DUF7707 domain-containing protein n=1 Tax=Hirsutella minnesotensis 3608 TaxID=1043627 RepID=A0A0F7ZVI0_9HYPO|nr:hypothetical protein HIM_03984 [Hirsutella minnesotensis 3608]
MRASTVIALFSAAMASAQSSTGTKNYTSELDMTIDPNSVKPDQRAIWCQGQTNTCNLLCNNNVDKNSCTQSTLKYECTCASNKSAPGLQYYVQTLPTFICQELFAQCDKENTGNADGQKACKTNIQDLCGKTPPPKAAVSDSGDDSSSSPSASQPSATGSGSASSSSPTASNVAVPMAAAAGNGAAAAALVGFVAMLF